MNDRHPSGDPHPPAPAPHADLASYPTYDEQGVPYDGSTGYDGSTSYDSSTGYNGYGYDYATGGGLATAPPTYATDDFTTGTFTAGAFATDPFTSGTHPTTAAFTGDFGTAHAAANSFESDPLFGDLPGSAGFYDDIGTGSTYGTGQWSNDGTLHAGAEQWLSPDPYAAQQHQPQQTDFGNAGFDDAGFDSTGGLHGSADYAATGSWDATAWQSTGQWETPGYGTQTWQDHSHDHGLFDNPLVDAELPDPEQFGTPGHTAPDSAPPGHDAAGFDVDPWQSEPQGYDILTATDGYATLHHAAAPDAEASSRSSAGHAHNGPADATTEYATTEYATGTTSADGYAYGTDGYAYDSYGPGSYDSYEDGPADDGHARTPEPDAEPDHEAAAEGHATTDHETEADTSPGNPRATTRATRRASTRTTARNTVARSGSGGRRRPAKRSALLTVVVPSACVIGVAGMAAASVDGTHDDKTSTSAADAASVKPSVANNKLDTQLENLSADAGDFADRASRTQERIDLKAKQAAERKKAAEEAARRERLRPKFLLPVSQHGLSAYFGQSGVNWMSVHTGIDFPVSYGTEVMAATDGTLRAQYNTAYGNMAIVTAPDGTETWYCHLSSYRLSSGSAVKAGDVIAFSGNSGNSTGPHLHFEVRPAGGSAIDPLPWLRSHGLDPT